MGFLVLFISYQNKLNKSSKINKEKVHELNNLGRINPIFRHLIFPKILDGLTSLRGCHSRKAWLFDEVLSGRSLTQLFLLRASSRADSILFIFSGFCSCCLRSKLIEFGLSLTFACQAIFSAHYSCFRHHFFYIFIPASFCTFT